MSAAAATAPLSKTQRGRRPANDSIKLLPLRGNESYGRPMVDPLAKGSKWWGMTKHWKSLRKGRVISELQYWFLEEIAERQFSVEARERADGAPGEWTRPITDEEMGREVGCSPRMIADFKQDALKRGLIAARLVGQTWCYRLLLENWASAPAAPSYQRKPVSSDDDPHSDGEQEAKTECKAVHSVTVEPGSRGKLIRKIGDREEEFRYRSEPTAPPVTLGFDKSGKELVVARAGPQVESKVPNGLLTVQDESKLLFEEFMGAFIAAGVAMNQKDVGNCRGMWLMYGVEEHRRILADVHLKLKNGEWPDAQRTKRPWNYLEEEQWTRVAANRVIPKTPKESTAQRERREANERALAWAQQQDRKGAAT